MNDEGEGKSTLALLLPERPTGMPVCARHSTPDLVVGINRY